MVLTSRPVRGDAAPVDDNTPGLAARKAAAKLLAAVIDAKTPLDGLTDQEHGHPAFMALDGRDRSLVRAILATALRYRGTIGRLISARLERPLPPNAHALSHILNVAAAQILFLDVPDSAAVDLAVTHASSDPRTKRFAGLVNGLLRGIARDKARMRPVELAKGDRCARVVPRSPGRGLRRGQGRRDPGGAPRRGAGGSHRQIGTRANGRMRSAASCCRPVPSGSSGCRVRSPSLPGYGEGAWWVQDAAAALPARLFGDLTGKRVADLCAAPGGKTAQLALAGGEVTALDMSANRLKRLGENLARLWLRDGAGQSRSPEIRVRLSSSMPCFSTHPVRRPARCAAIPMCRGRSRRRTSPNSPTCRPACCAPPRDCGARADASSFRTARSIRQRVNCWSPSSLPSRPPW